MSTHGLEISSLAYYPNNLAGDDAASEEANAHLRKVIDAAAALEVGIVGTFVGADQTLPLPENLAALPHRLAAPRRVRGGARREDRHRELPDDLQLGRVAERPEHRHSPAVWDEMFEAIPSESFGLNLDPRISSGCRSTTSGSSTTTRRASSTSTQRISRSAATGCTATAPCRSAWGGRCRDCPGSARCAGTASSRRCMRSATTSSSRSSTRTGFEATEELVKRGFLLSRNVLRPLLV